MEKKKVLTVQGTEIHVISEKEDDFISLTDIAKRFSERSDQVISNWIRTRNTIDFLGVWESMHNEVFNPQKFEEIRNKTGSPTFVLSVSDWVNQTVAVGIKTKKGRYGGGTFAQKDIALEFCSWLNPAFRLYVIQEFQRLKVGEAKSLDKVWNLRREIAKANYHIQTDAIREHLVPQLDWRTKREAIFFASEADLLNTVVFGMTAKQWKAANPEAKGNLRDSATVEELQVMANMESLNAAMISQGFNQEERFSVLTKRTERELDVLNAAKAMDGVKKLEEQKNRKLK